MSRGNVLLYFLLIILIIGGLGWYLYKSIFPTQSDVESKKPQIIIIPPDILSNNADLFQKLSGFSSNGNFPIQIDKGGLGKTDPFVR